MNTREEEKFFQVLSPAKQLVLLKGSKVVKLCNERRGASAKGREGQTAVNELALMHPAGDAYPERAQN